MRIPCLAEPRSAHKLEGHVILFGAGAASEVYRIGRATTLIYARHGAVTTCIDIDLDASVTRVELAKC